MVLKSKAQEKYLNTPLHSHVEFFKKKSEKDDIIPSRTLSNYSQITKLFTQKYKLF